MTPPEGDAETAPVPAADGRVAAAARAVQRGIVRARRAWGALDSDRRLAAIAALALVASLLLPWYQRHYFVSEHGQYVATGDSLTGFGAFSFVEGADLLVAVAVLWLLFARAEGRSFQLPGGDGVILMAAGLWTAVLVIWRILDKQGAESSERFAATYGIEWGIFVALAAAGVLAYAGSRVRASERGRRRDSMTADGGRGAPPPPATRATTPAPDRTEPEAVRIRDARRRERVRARAARRRERRLQDG